MIVARLPPNLTRDNVNKHLTVLSYYSEVTFEIAMTAIEQHQPSDHQTQIPNVRYGRGCIRSTMVRKSAGDPSLSRGYLYYQREEHKSNRKGL